MEHLADAEGVSAPVLRMRRRRAETRLVTALARGQVRDVLTAKPGLIVTGR